MQVQSASQTDQILDAKQELMHLKSYLQSEKFHKDNYVSVQDVLNRLSAIEECLSETYFDIKFENYSEFVGSTK